MIEAILPDDAGALVDDVVPLVHQAIAGQTPQLQRDLRLLLRALEWRAFNAILTGTGSSFSNASRAQREQILRAFARSRSALLRQGFQGLKRLALLYYYVLNDARVNREIGYTPAPAFPARARLLPVTPAAAALDCDVCVIGSGAGGGVSAAVLSQAGFNVIVLEAAAPVQADQFEQRELAAMRSLYLQEARLTSRDLSMTLVAGSALGGGTTVNWQTSLRPPAVVREDWARRSGCAFFTEPSFDTALAAVLAGAHVDTDENQINPNNEALRRGCAALGYDWSLIPRNAHGCDPEQCGYCTFGCRHGGKQSTTVSFLAIAVATGNTRIVADCRAERVEISKGRVMGVQARTSAGLPVAVRCQRVVVAAGGIDSPLLLLRSGVRLPAVGRHLLLHPTTCIAGVYDDPIRPFHGPPQTVVSNQFADLDQGYGVRLEVAPAHPGLFALASPWQSAAAHQVLMRQFSHTSVIIALTRDHEGGRIWQGARGHRLIDYQPGPREIGYLSTGITAAARIHHAAGARQIVLLHSQTSEWRRGQDFDAFVARIPRLAWDRNWAPLFSAHQMGTCRMGVSPDSAVCDQNGEVFGVKGLFIGDASAFPGSSGVNPMITVMALAHHSAERLVMRV